MINLFTCRKRCEKAVSVFGTVSMKTNTAGQVQQGRGGLGLEIGQNCGVRQRCHQGEEKWW